MAPAVEAYVESLAPGDSLQGPSSYIDNPWLAGVPGPWYQFAEVDEAQAAALHDAVGDAGPYTQEWLLLLSSEDYERPENVRLMWPYVDDETLNDVWHNPSGTCWYVYSDVSICKAAHAPGGFGGKD